jgi:hypothetical protein
MRATFPTILIILDLNTLISVNDKYKLLLLLFIIIIIVFVLYVNFLLSALTLG